MSRKPTTLRIVAPTGKASPRYANEGDVHTLKYSGELVLVSDLSPVMIVRQGGKLERWNGIEGREGSGARRN
jgi:hypothetical protein